MNKLLSSYDIIPSNITSANIQEYTQFGRINMCCSVTYKMDQINTSIFLGNRRNDFI